VRTIKESQIRDHPDVDIEEVNEEEDKVGDN